MSQLLLGLNTIQASGTYTLPTNANYQVSIEMFGGGGGGGGGGLEGTNGGGGGGGGGGGRTIVSSEVISGEVTVTVGNGGGSSVYATGSNGSTTTLIYTPVNGSTTTLTANGGGGGRNGVNGGAGGSSPSGFTGGNGGRNTQYDTIPPSNGIGAANNRGYAGNGNNLTSTLNPANYYIFGGGGGGYNGSGGNGANALNTTAAAYNGGENGFSYGGGGGGANDIGPSPSTPGNGANGVVIINIITVPPTITATVDTTTTLNHFIVTAIPSTGPTTGPTVEPITGYTMTVTPPISTGLTPITYTGTNPTNDFSGVFSGIDYTITVVAHSNIGDSNIETLSDVRFVATANNPAPCNYPTPPVATPGPGYQEITVSFYTSPSDTVGSYLFNSTPAVATAPVYATDPGVLTHKIYSNLTIGQDYTFIIYSKNSLGNGNAPSLSTSPVQPLNVIPPVITPLTVGNSTLNVSFTPQTQDSAITPTNYTIALSASSPNAVIPPSQTVTVAQAPIGVSHTNIFSGLTNGVIYTATVTINATSNSIPVSSSSTATGTPNGPPAPAIITSINNTTENQLVVNFTPSTSPTSYVTSYTVSLTAPGQTVPSQTVISAPYISVFTGLVAGVTYTAVVNANYSGGTVPSSTFPKIATGNASPVTISSAVAGNQQITVTWTPSATPYSQLGDYEIILTPTSGSPVSVSVNVPSLTTTSTVTGLVNGITYTVYVFAKGNGTNVYTYEISSTNSLTATPNGPPAPATITSINNATPNQLVVNFTPSTSPTSYVTSYTVSLTAPGQTVPSQTVISAPYISVFTGLVAGVTYTAVVNANYSGGTVPSSTFPKIATGNASPVTISSAVAGNQQITVTWTPSATPFSQLGNYEIILTPTSGSPVSFNVPPTSAPTISQVIPSLTNYMQYTVSVFAKGTGMIVTDSTPVSVTPVPSTNSLTATPQGPPAPATNISINNPTPNQLVVNFNASTTPSSALDPYIVSLTAPSGFPSVLPISVPINTLPLSATFLGLVNGITYTAIVTTDPSAAGIASTLSTSVTGTPNGPLAHPTNVIATGSNQQLSVAFTAVNPVGTLYTATATAAGQPTVSNLISSSSSPIVLTGLVNFINYSVTVVASHSSSLLGNSTPPVGFLPTLGTPSGPPDPATNVNITALGDGELVVTWAPSPTPPSAITYSVTLTSTVPGTSPQTLNVTPPNPSTGLLSVTFQGLLNGASYSAVVSTIAGSNPPANAPTVSGQPQGIPTQPSVSGVVGNQSIFATVTPSINPVSYIAGYTLNLLNILTGVSTIYSMPANGPYTYVLTGLTNDTSYSLTVIANAIPPVSPLFINTSQPVNLVTTVTLPNVNATTGDGSIQITLEDMLNTQDTVEYFVIVAYEDPENPGAQILVPNASPYSYGTTSITIPSLSNGTLYSVSLYAKDVGPGIDESPIFNALLTPQMLKTTSPICYVKGTLIGTSRGMIPIENLLMSDKLRTYDRIEENMFEPVHGIPVKTLTRVQDMRFKNRFAGIKFIGKFTVKIMNENTAPIHFTAGSLGHSKPERDLLVSPNHSMLVGNRLIFAKKLVNGSTIFQDMSFKMIEYFHVLSDDHYLINANGALSETLGSEEISLFESLHSFPEYIENNFNYSLKKNEDKDLMSFESIPKVVF